MRPVAPLLAIVLSVSATSAVAERLSVPYEMFRLPNGLTVIVHEDHSAPDRLASNTWYHVGSAREKPGRTGFAHLFEHLMFEGSKNVPEGAFDRCSRPPAATTTARPTRTGRTTTRTCRRTRSSCRSSSRPTAWATCSTRCPPRRSTASATS